MSIIFFVEQRTTIRTTHRFCVLAKIDMVIMYSSVFCGSFTSVENTATSAWNLFLTEDVSVPLPVPLNDT